MVAEWVRTPWQPVVVRRGNSQPVTDLRVFSLGIERLIARMEASALFSLAYFSAKAGREYLNARLAIVDYLSRPALWTLPTAEWVDVPFLVAQMPVEMRDACSPVEWYFMQAAGRDVGPTPLVLQQPRLQRAIELAGNGT
ncbi:MAG: hypothetical protein R3E84_10170 [Pseudomonadales bacterium]